MKYLKLYKIFERELPETWFKENPKSYVVANDADRILKRSEKGSVEYIAQKNKKLKNEKLTDIKWQDIKVVLDEEDEYSRHDSYFH